MDRDESRSLAASAADEIQRLRVQLQALGGGQARGEAGLAAKGERLAALNAAEAELVERMGRNQAQLSRLLGALELYRRNPPPALLVAPKNATDAVNAAILLKALEPQLAARAAAFRQEAERLKAIRRRILLANGDILSAETEAQDRRAEIERLIARERALEESLDRTADDAARDARRLAAEAKALGVPAPGLEAGPGNQPLSLRPPVREAAARRFGEVDPEGRRSEGLTFHAAPGEIVAAPAEGRVDYAGGLKGWGGVVILRLPGERHLVLAGLGAASARMGSAVAAGEPIGRMAAVRRLGEDKGGPELYLELREGETPVDPARWLNRTTARGDP